MFAGLQNPFQTYSPSTKGTTQREELATTQWVELRFGNEWFRTLFVLEHANLMDDFFFFFNSAQFASG